MGAGGPPGAPPCADELMPLRNDAQTKGMAIKAAIDRKAERGEICKVFRTFVAAEAKFVKFAQDNGSRCSVPAEAVKVMKANHSKSVSMSNRVCNAAAGPAAARPRRRVSVTRSAPRASRIRPISRPARAAPSTPWAAARSRDDASPGRVADATGNWVDSSRRYGRGRICGWRGSTGRSDPGCS